MPAMPTSLKTELSWALLSSHAFNLALGPVLLFFGYMILPTICFICGFLTGVLLTDAFLMQHSLLVNESHEWMSSVVLIIPGLLLGWIAFRMITFGMFTIGSACAVFILTSFFPNLALTQQKNQTLNVYGLMFAVVLGILTACLQKPLLITATSFVGACAIVFSLSFYLGHVDNPFLSLIPITPPLSGSSSHPSPSVGVDWAALFHDPNRSIILLSLAFLTILGIHTQYTVTRNWGFQGYNNNDSSNRQRGYAPL